RYFSETMLDYVDLTKGRPIADVPLSEVINYACADADTSYRLVEPMLEELDAAKSKSASSLKAVFEQIEMPLIPVLEEMERNGILIYRIFLETLSAVFQSELVELIGTILQLAGVTFNLNSLKQLIGILFDKMSISTVGIKRTQSAVSTDASV